MNSEQKLMVQSSFRGVLAISDLVADLFYRRLFLLDPSLQPMFKGDIKEQGRKLMNVLRVCVAGLDRLEQLVPTVEALGKRHVGYGVRDEHYDTVATALLWALQQGLGDAFTPAVAAAWVEVYTLLANVMRAAASVHEEEMKALRAAASRQVSFPSLILAPPPARLSQPPPPRLSQPPPVRGSRLSYSHLAPPRPPSQPPPAF